MPIFLRGRLLTGILLAYCVGVLLGKLCAPASLPVFILLFVVTSCTLLMGLFDKDIRPMLLLCGAVLGLFLCSLQINIMDAWGALGEEPLCIEGRLCGGASSDQAGDGYQFTLAVRQINGQKAHWGRVYVYSKGDAPPPGSRIRFQATATRPDVRGNENTFDYNEYLERQGIKASLLIKDADDLELISSAKPWSAASLSAWFRDSLEAGLQQLDEKQSSLVRGVFLGDKSELSYEQSASLGLSGIAHAFAVSGLHIGYIVMLAVWLGGSAYQNRWRRLGTVVLLLLYYISLTGIRPSILRAVFMSLLTLLGLALGESRDFITSLSLAALISLIYDPLWLLDSGFQLSYGAVLGIALYRSSWEKGLASLPPLFSEALSSGLAANTLTLPLIAYYFYHISWLGCILSPLAVWIAGLSVCLAMLAAICSLFSVVVSSFLLQTASWPLQLLYFLADRLSALPGASSLPGALSPWLVIAVTLLLIFWPRLWAYISRKVQLRESQSRRKSSVSGWLTKAPHKPIILGASLILLLFSLLPQLWPQVATEQTEVVFLDVGQGDATLIITPEHYHILVDGGGSWQSGAVGQYTLLPYLKSRGINHIDLLVSTHPDRDHIDGLLSVLENLPVDTVCYSALAEQNQQQTRLLELSREQRVINLPLRGQRIQVGQQTELLFYPQAATASRDNNESSLVCMLSCQGVNILLTADATATTLRELSQRYDLRADILHLPHHGSKSNYDPEFYAAVGSKAAIISVGEDNSYGHPADLVVEYWQEHGSLYRTDQQGAITLYIQDADYRIETYR